MIVTTKTAGTAWQRVAMGAVLLAGVSAFATAAFAGECPASNMGADLTKPVTTPAKDVTDKVLASIDLSKEPAQLQDRQLRLRKLKIKEGGIVGSVALGHIFDRHGWTACVGGIGAALLAAALLAIRLRMTAEAAHG